MGRLASSAAVSPLSLMSTLSRMLLDRGSVLVLHFADEIDHRALGAAAPRQRQFAARNLHHHRHEIFGAVQLEVIHLHGDGQVGDGVAQHQGVFELPLFVRGGELIEFLAGEISRR